MLPDQHRDPAVGIVKLQGKRHRGRMSVLRLIYKINFKRVESSPNIGVWQTPGAHRHPARCARIFA
jgi:hypothetical protein